MSPFKTKFGNCFRRACEARNIVGFRNIASRCCHWSAVGRLLAVFFCGIGTAAAVMYVIYLKD